MAGKGSWLCQTKQYPVPWVTRCVYCGPLWLISKVSRYHTQYTQYMSTCTYVHTYILCCWVVFLLCFDLQSPIVITYNKLQLPKEKHFDIGELFGWDDC